MSGKVLKLKIIKDSVESAKIAGLRYVSDCKSGIKRLKSGKGFKYVESNGQVVNDEATSDRIRSLVIPPAWTDVWICSSSNGHLQATGRDARGRKQYRYHPKWKEVRDENKFGKMIGFALVMPRIRDAVDKDLASTGFSRKKVLAAIVHLLELTLIRVGNEEYARSNQSYGLTTLRNSHVQVLGSKIRFNFRGKSGKQYSIGVRNKRLAKIVKRCQELPGQDLFAYLDENKQPVDISSTDVNEYLREITQDDFTAKDFRTWAGTVLAAMALQESGDCGSKTQAKRNIVAVVKKVAEHLGNTPAVCKKCYIHPGVIDGYLDGSILKAGSERKSVSGLAPEEATVVNFLQQLAKAS